jgi:hypothetical protein
VRTVSGLTRRAQRDAGGCLAISQAVVQGWGHDAGRRVGGPARLRLILLAVLGVSLLLDGASVLGARGRGSAVPVSDTVLGLALTGLFAVLGLVAAAAIGVILPDTADLDLFVAGSGLRPGLRRLAAALPFLAVMGALIVILALPISLALSPALTPGSAGMRLLGAWCAGGVGLMTGRAIISWVTWAAARARIPPVLARAIGCGVALLPALGVLRVTRTATDPGREVPWQTEILGALVLPGRMSAPAVVLALLVQAVLVAAVTACPAPGSATAGSRPIPLLRQRSLTPTPRWRGVAVSALREPTIALWVVVCLASPALLLSMQGILGAPATGLAGLLLAVPALMAGYPHGISTPTRYWLRAAAPSCGVGSDLLATAVMVGAAGLAVAVLSWLFVGVTPSWPIGLLVAGSALFWGRLLPVQAGSPASWFTLDVLGSASAVAICVVAVRVALRWDSLILLQAIAVVVLGTSVAVVVAMDKRGRLP